MDLNIKETIADHKFRWKPDDLDLSLKENLLRSIPYSSIDPGSDENIIINRLKCVIKNMLSWKGFMSCSNRGRKCSCFSRSNIITKQDITICTNTNQEKEIKQKLSCFSQAIIH